MYAMHIVEAIAMPPPLRVADLWLLLEVGISKIFFLDNTFIVSFDKVIDKIKALKAIRK